MSLCSIQARHFIHNDAALRQKQALVLRQQAKRTGCIRTRRVACRASSGADDDDETLREQRRKLDALFFGSAQAGAESEEAAAVEASAARPAAPSPLPHVLEDLPLWRVQWAMLPGLSQLLNVHVPHYCYMFEQLMTQQKPPWLFGHLLLPGGSANLGDPDYAMRPGTRASTVGCLMEVTRAVRLSDGRLVVLARGVARFRVASVRQATPYSRADVVVLPDGEEVDLQRDTAMATSGDLAASSADVARLMRTVDAAATVAAAAAAQVWWTWEADAMANQTTSGGGGGATPRLLAPETSAEELRAVEEVAGAEYEALAMPSAEVIQAEAAVLSAVAAAASGAALRAAAETAARCMGEEEEEGGGATARRSADDDLLSGPWVYGDGGTPVIPPAAPSPSGSPGQLAASMGSADLVASSGSGAGERDNGEEADANDNDDDLAAEWDSLPDGLPGLLKLEGRVWQELDSVCALAARVSARPFHLPPVLRTLRPPLGNRSQGSLFARSADGDDGTSNGNTSSGGSGAPPVSGQAAAAAADGDTQGSSSSSSRSGGAPNTSSGRQGQQQQQQQGRGGGQDEQQQQQGEGEQLGPEDMLALRRVQKVSYLMSLLLPEVSASEGRQALLQCDRAALRLREMLGALRKQRRVMAAVAALKGLEVEDPLD